VEPSSPACASPEVSVVIPMRDRVWCIERALRSVFAAGCDSVEAIVVDDGSHDRSLDAVRAFAEAHPGCNLRWTAHAGGARRGVGASRNLGAAMARGGYLAFLDSDDEFLPGRFDHALAILRTVPEIDGVYEAQEIMESDGQTTLRPLAESIEPSRLGNVRMVPNNLPTTGSLVVRKALFDRVGGFDEGKWVGEDINLWLRMAVGGHLVPGRRDVPVVRHHRHAANVGGFDPWHIVLREFASVRHWAWRHQTPADGRHRLRALCAKRIFGYLGEFGRTPRSARDRLRLVGYSLRCLPGLAFRPRFWYAAIRMCWFGGIRPQADRPQEDKG
jgi:glycosyltransferase involved in cell wall biosynthesis